MRFKPFLKKFVYIFKYYIKFNLITAFKLSRLAMSNIFLSRQKIYSVRVYGVNLSLRSKTTDLNVFNQIFVKEELNIPLDEPKCIIDGGAYSGLSSIYLAHKYPNCDVYALEPEDSNYKLLLAHSSQFTNIKPIHSGLWSKDVKLTVFNENKGQKWSFKVKEDLNGEIAATSIKTLISKNNLSKVDLLKLDIEGSEDELFKKNYCQWLDKVNCIAVEFHERYAPGSEKRIRSVLLKEGFKSMSIGEKEIFIR